MSFDRLFHSENMLGIKKNWQELVLNLGKIKTGLLLDLVSWKCSDGAAEKSLQAELGVSLLERWEIGSWKKLVQFESQVLGQTQSVCLS